MQITRRQLRIVQILDMALNVPINVFPHSFVIYFFQILPNVNPIRELNPSPQRSIHVGFSIILVYVLANFCLVRTVNVVERKTLGETEQKYTHIHAFVLAYLSKCL